MMAMASVCIRMTRTSNANARSWLSVVGRGYLGGGFWSRRVCCQPVSRFLVVRCHPAPMIAMALVLVGPRDAVTFQRFVKSGERGSNNVEHVGNGLAVVRLPSLADDANRLPELLRRHGLIRDR